MNTLMLSQYTLGYISQSLYQLIHSYNWDNDYLHIIELITLEEYLQYRDNIISLLGAEDIPPYDGHDNFDEDDNEFGDISTAIITCMNERYPPETANIHHVLSQEERNSLCSDIITWTDKCTQY